MADLLSCRLNESVPSTHCGKDMFRPFVVMQRRSEVKCYGAMFPCMASRAIYIEVTFNLDTDSFILALRRPVARCGNVRSAYSDNGSNFIGAERELKKAYSEMNDNKIQSFMEGIGGDWIKWHKNPPFASHMGGVWERQIRSARAILASMLKTHGKTLDDESLLTLITEVEGILNSWHHTVEMINDQALAYEACDRTHTPLHMPETLETCKKSMPCLIKKPSRCVADHMSKTTTFFIFHFL